LSYKMIADHCNISYNTVNTHISHIYRKLQVNSVAEAIKKAIDQKIV
jgi:DNA-binding NarL/FixJ family response regulator